MHLVTFSDGGATRIGMLDRRRGELVDLSQAAPKLPRDMLAFIALGDAGFRVAHDAYGSGDGRVPQASVRLLAPIPRPARNIICVGKNYRDHVKEVQATAIAGADKDGVPE